nr:hypothetical protein [Tanacetum cinerariifolium]
MLGTKRGFLSKKRSEGGRGVKEKQQGDNGNDTTPMHDFVIRIPMVDNTMPVSYINVMPTKPSFVPSSANEVTKEPNVIEKPKSPVSFAKLVTCDSSRKSVNFCTLVTPSGKGVDVVVPFESIRAISKQFVNTTYDVILGNRVAYHVVANYVINTWGKYRLVKLVLNSSTRLFFFQFSSIDGLDSMLENVWVKLHGVLVTAFTGDGLSAIATKLVIKLRADVELKDTIVVVIPKLVGQGFYTCTLRVKY